MKKKILYATAAAGMLFLGINAQAQILEEENVTITMDLQPILQLNMTTADQVDFVFADVGSYNGGIVKYGATQLRISSSVNWDLYAVGFSQGQINPTDWDQMVAYGAGAGANGVNTIPLDALELRQYPANPAAGGNPDYSLAFPAYDPALGQGQGGQTNTIHVDGVNPYNRPGAADKYIAGHDGPFPNAVEGGSYLTTNLPAGTQVAPAVASPYFYTIDYRIIPGLPAVFPMAAAATNNINAAAGEYAQPGVYTMNVKYVLLEDI